MRIVLIADTFLPFRGSGAVQVRDLAREFVRQGHALTLLIPSPSQRVPWVLEKIDGIQVLRLKAPRTKDVGYVRRALSEFAMPYVMLWHFQKSPLCSEQWSGVVWYAPSIFFGPLANVLKKNSNCKGYLIIRDIFPEWAIDVGLMERGPAYWFFVAVARYQYSVADIIGVQTPGNLAYFDRWQEKSDHKLEVLQNWLDKPAQARCPIRVSETSLAYRKIFVYAGNMGVAQSMDIALDLAEQLKKRIDVGFLFVGRGSESTRLKTSVIDRKLDNVLFYDEIHPDEIPDLYAQCSAGIVSLDSRHKSHNIPGKFLTYMQCGLPVLANVNLGNDLAEILRDARVGQVCENNTIENLVQLALKLLEQIEQDVEIPARCRRLFQREFTVDKTVRQIIAALSP